MSARTKLNALHGLGSALLALILAALCDSWLVFWLTWGLLWAADVSSGQIRLRSRRHRRS